MFVPGALKCQKKTPDPLEIELQMVRSAVCSLPTKPWFSVREASVLNCWALSPAPNFSIFFVELQTCDSFKNQSAPGAFILTALAPWLGTAASASPSLSSFPFQTTLKLNTSRKFPQIQFSYVMKNNHENRAGKMTRWVKVLSAKPELGSVPSPTPLHGGRKDPTSPLTHTHWINQCNKFLKNETTWNKH